MLSDRELHDGSFAITQSIIDAFPDEFKQDKAQAFYEIYIRVKAGIEGTLALSDRMQRRISPKRN